MEISLPIPPSRSRRASTLFFVVFTLTLSAVFSGALRTIARSWGEDEYSHGYFIPLIALLLLLDAMEDSAAVPRTSWVGFGLVVACVTLNTFFTIAGIKGILPEIYLLALIGGVIAFWGVKAARRYAGPLGFLLFCAPLPQFFYYTLSVDMQMLSTSLGAAMLEALNVPVFQDGNVIDLGGYKLQVVEACSGLRYLFPLLSLSYLFAYLYKASYAKRALLFVSAIPIALLMNSLRIALIGVTVDRWGTAMAEGLLHEMEGGIVFLCCTLCLLAEVGLLQRIGRKGRFDWDVLARLPAFAKITAPAIGAPAYAAAAVVTLALLAVAALPGMKGEGLHDVALRQPFSAFPLTFGPWVGHFVPFDTAALAKLGAKDYLLADYVKPGAPAVNLYAIYYAHQDSSSNNAVHTPAVCIPAGGWTVAASGVTTLTLAGGTHMTVNRVLVSKDAVREVVYYWYVQDGQQTWDYNLSKLYQMRSAISNGTTNGAMVRLVTAISPGESPDQAQRRIADFMNASLATLNSFMFDGKKRSTM